MLRCNMSSSTDISHLLERYAALRHALQEAHLAPARLGAERIERLAEELTAVERAIARSQSPDEQTSETFPAFRFTR